MLELLTVLLLLAVMAAVAAPSTSRFLENLNFRRHTQKIMTTLRYARLLSISSGHNVRVTLAEDTGAVFRIMGAAEEFRPINLDRDELLTMDPPEIIYYPEGQATSATITFSRAERKLIISLDMLTALPIIEDSADNP